MNLERKIEEKEARICVIGLGYVGLPLAVEFARVGFPVTGLDVDEERVSALNLGQSYIRDVDAADVAEAVQAGHFSATGEYDVLKEMDVILICVPTPFTKTKTPDLSYVVAAAQEITPRLKGGQLVILQSTTYPGTTDEDVLPILEGSGLVAGRDFHLAFSPERVNPGDSKYTVTNTPKVVGGVSPRCGELAQQLLRHLMPDVYLVSSPRAAEMTKLLENIYRSVNIALINELAKLSERMGIDIWEVIEAASTKPFGFMPFYPGPGVGGHCVPVDPYYLFWKAREYDFYPRFIELAAELNQSMPYFVVTKINEALNAQGKNLRKARVLVLGVSFKPDVDDARNSPAQRVIELLSSKGAQVTYNDPYIPQFTVGKDVFYHEELTLASTPLTQELLATHDCVVIVAGHSSYDYDWIVAHAPLVIDTMNATRDVRAHREKVFRIGAPSPGR
ncbi:MAG: UDP-N-acetyl-D-glucosamine dehydrogenase [Chloroflexi bacterium B3_Chlor]|nr:MAG: UDP-N-acetyl-D-glucosamine dehydrogenase [Chloroflexi bacterium B3_Chlor]